MTSLLHFLSIDNLIFDLMPFNRLFKWEFHWGIIGWYQCESMPLFCSTISEYSIYYKMKMIGRQCLLDSLYKRKPLFLYLFPLILQADSWNHVDIILITIFEILTNQIHAKFWILKNLLFFLLIKSFGEFKWIFPHQSPYPDL